MVKGISLIQKRIDFEKKLGKKMANEFLEAITSKLKDMFEDKLQSVDLISFSFNLKRMNFLVGAVVTGNFADEKFSDLSDRFGLKRAFVVSKQFQDQKVFGLPAPVKVIELVAHPDHNWVKFSWSVDYDPQTNTSLVLLSSEIVVQKAEED